MKKHPLVLLAIVFSLQYVHAQDSSKIILGDPPMQNTTISGSNIWNFKIDSIQPPAQFALGGSYSGSPASFFITAYGKLAAYQNGDSTIVVLDSAAAIRSMMQCLKYYFQRIKPQEPLCLCGKLHK